MDTLIINESLSQDLIIPDDNTVTIPIQIEKNGKQYFPDFDESIGGRNLFLNSAFHKGNENWNQLTVESTVSYPENGIFKFLARSPSGISRIQQVVMVSSKISLVHFITVKATTSEVGLSQTDRPFDVHHSGSGNFERLFTNLTLTSSIFRGVRDGRTSDWDEVQFTKPYIGLGDENTPWTPAPEELLELSSITSNFCKVTKDNNNIILSDFSTDQGYIEFEVPYGDDWTINHRVNITRDIKFRPLAFDNRLLKFQDRLLHIRETPHIMYSELMDYAYSNHIETPPTNNLRALNYLYKNLESEGLDMFDWLYNFAYINTPEQFKLLNLWNKRGYDGTAYGGLMWSNEGVQGNGVNGYIDTNFDLNLPDRTKAFQGVVVSVNSDPLGSSDYSILTGGMPATSHDAVATFDRSANQRLYIGGAANNFVFGGQGLKLIFRDNTNITMISKTDYLTNVREIFTNNTTPSSLRILSRLLSLTSVAYGTSKIMMAMFGEGITYEQTQTFRKVYNKYLSSIGLTPIA